MASITKMRFLLLSVLCLFVSTVMAETNSTDLKEDMKLLLEKPTDAPNPMQRPIKDKSIDISLGLSQITEQDLEDREILTVLWVFSLYLIIASIIKMVYHQSNFLTTTIPESCVLIMIGIGFGTLIKINEFKNTPQFTVNLFFFGLMPPIILQSAFTLHNEYFFGNIITIIMYAVVGTLINESLTGLSLFICSVFELKFWWFSFPKISLIELLIFSNAISAVDPVTVLTIFQDLKVNKPLYYLVFGESLLNDAVVIVVHTVLDKFIRSPIITSSALINGFNSFFIMSIGGFLIGVFFGLVTAFITLYTKHSLVIEPMVMVGMAYSSFLTADLLGWSGLISLIGCGLVQYEFAFVNISRKTRITVKYFITTLSSVSDLLIFFFLGQMLMNEDQVWNSAFVLSTIIFCLLFRTVSVYSLTYISNHYFHRSRPINWEEQALMAYGGLRGAVAFAMIALLKDNPDIENFGLLKTTTFLLIFFTVFVLGGTTKPILNCLRIQKEGVDTKKISFFLNDKVIDIVINGIEDFVGNPSTMNFFRHKLNDLVKYLKKYLCQKNADKIQYEIPKLMIRESIKVSEKDIVIDSEKKDDIHVYTEQNISPQIEDLSKNIEKISKTVETNAEKYRNIVSKKLNKNAFHLKEVHRKHTIPKEMSSRMFAANQYYKPSNNKRSPFRSNTVDLIQRFKSPGTQSQTNSSNNPLP